MGERGEEEKEGREVGREGHGERERREEGGWEGREWGER